MPSSPVTPAPRLVVDIGNTRVKWGLCDAGAVVKSASLPPDEPAAWRKQLAKWRLTGPLVWAVSGVHPQRRDHLADWLLQRGDTVSVVISPKDLPLEVKLRHPGRVGIDRLLNAVAVNSRRTPQTSAIIIDAGSAITVDYVDEHGVFRGGAILPGLRLMAKSLHDYTALLPLVEIDADVPVPATSTPEAMKAGIFAAAAGGIRFLIEKLTSNQVGGKSAQVFFAGGDGALLGRQVDPKACVWPLMTLEGLRIAVSPAEGE
jgi:type III pantothenate kinase